MVPNISIYYKAALGNSIEIIKDINKHIGITSNIIDSVFQTNNTDSILFIMEEAIKDNIKINQNMVAYPILNNNLIIIHELEKQNLINWHYELCYPAILSGSIQTLELIESKISDIHEKLLLDISKDRKGQVTLLLGDMMYRVNNKIYFSHAINYAIQSRSLDMVKYIHSKGYQITASNFITSIKQSTVEILQYLSKNYHTELPFYTIHYFGMSSFVSEKLEKAKILLDSGLLKLSPSVKLKRMDYQTETAHVDMIMQTGDISLENIMDPDYLMKYQLFFVPLKGFKLNYRLLTRLKISLELDLDEELNNIFCTQYNLIDSQFVLDELILFGNIKQITKFYPLFNEQILHRQKNNPSPKKLVPSEQIIMEIICYRQINKLAYLLQKDLLSTMVQYIYPLIITMNDYGLNLFGEKLGVTELSPEHKLKFILLSGNLYAIDQWLEQHRLHYQHYFDQNIFKMILSIDNINLIKKFMIPNELLENLIIWAEENDLLEIKKFLSNYTKDDHINSS